MEIPKDLIIKISGARGVFPSALNDGVAFTLAKAFAEIMPAGSIVVSRDSRVSGKALKKAVIAALTQQGRVVLDADIIPLPTTQVAAIETGSAGAIDVTASHNPAEYNGLKFLDSKGIYIDLPEVEKLKQNAKQFDGKISYGIDQTFVKDIHKEAIEWHLNKIKNKIYPGKKLIVAVDATNGAGSVIIPELLKLMGCDVLPLAIDPEKPFPHIPEPTPVNLEWTREKLKGKKFDLCVVADPDADRLVLIDEKIDLLSEELTLPIVLEEVIAQGKTGIVVVNMSTSQMIEEVSEPKGVIVKRSPVGEMNVVHMMQKENAFFGGEGNGGVIDPEIHYGRDSIVGILNVVNKIRRDGKTLSEIADSIGKYEMRKKKFPISRASNLKEIYGKLTTEFKDAKINYDDGLKLSWKDKWIHIRPSNTEPIFRITGEAKTSKEIEELMAKSESLIK